jgi:hypothetical protein
VDTRDLARGERADHGSGRTQDAEICSDVAIRAAVHAAVVGAFNHRVIAITVWSIFPRFNPSMNIFKLFRRTKDTSIPKHSRVGDFGFARSKP